MFHSRGRKIFTAFFGAAFCICGSNAYRSTFLHGSRLVLGGHRTTAQSRNGMTMYFDDVSRYTQHWHPKEGNIPWLTGPEENQVEKRAEQKNEKSTSRRQDGYDSESATALLNTDVKDEIQEWAHRSGLVGKHLGDEPYESLEAVHVSNATTISQVMSDFWKFTMTTIQEGTSEVTGRWVGSKSHDSKESSLRMIVFPRCKELYDYKVMSTVHAAIDFCSEICLHFGKQFTLTHFHPKYKNAQDMVHPTRHSPFPCLGLHFAGEFDDYVSRLSHKYGSDRAKTIIASAAPAPSREWVKERAATFEVLFNKAAASSTQDDLGRPTSLRNLSQRFPKEEVIEAAQSWVSQNKLKQVSTLSINAVNTPKRELNKALEFADTVGEWNVVYDKIPEEVYFKIWAAISKLDTSGEALDVVISKAKSKSKDGEEVKSKYSQLEWMSLLPLPSFKNCKEENDGYKVDVISSMFVTTKFRAYNSEGFKRFAVTINAALKRLTGGKIFLEVFHPEYVGRKGYDNKLRRSPFPMIQICYQVGKPVYTKEQEHTEGQV